MARGLTLRRPTFDTPSRRVVAICLALLLCISLPPTRVTFAHSTDGDDPFEDAVKLLAQVLTPRTGPDHRSIVQGLRDLGDPDTRPLFIALSQSEKPALRVNGLLAMATLEDPPRVDPWQLRQLQPEDFREMALSQAVAANLIGPPELATVLQWDDIGDELAISVLMILASERQPLQSSMVRSILDRSNVPEVRARAALILMHLGESDGVQDGLASLEELPTNIRREAIRQLVKSLRLHPVSGVEPWILEVLRRDDLDSTTTFEAIFALLTLEPAAGSEKWKASYESSDGLGHRLRHALMLLDVAETVEPSLFDTIASDSDALLRDIGRAGQAVARQADGVDESLQLITHHHRQSLWWILERADAIESPGQKTRLLQALIDDANNDGGGTEDRLEVAHIASRRLAALDVDALAQSLMRSRQRQRRLSEIAILGGALSSGQSSVVALSDAPHEPLSSRARSMELLLKARYGTPLSESERDSLIQIFRGGGSLSLAYQAQAAWLYLKMSEQHGTAIAAIVGGAVSRREQP